LRKRSIIIGTVLVALVLMTIHTNLIQSLIVVELHVKDNIMTAFAFPGDSSRITEMFRDNKNVLPAFAEANIAHTLNSAEKGQSGSQAAIPVLPKHKLDNTAAVYGSANTQAYRLTPYTAHILALTLFLFLSILILYVLYGKNKKLKTEAQSLAVQHQNAGNLYSLLLSTLQSTADGILVVDLQGRINFYNGQFRKIWNIPDHIISQKEDIATLQYVKESFDDPESFIDGVLSVYNHKQDICFDEVKLKDGRTIERYSIPQYSEGAVIGRVWSFRDITQRKRAEADLIESERTKSVFLSNLPGMAYRRDNTEGWPMSYVSDGCAALTGYRPEELLDEDKRPFVRLILPDYRERVWEAFERAMKANRVFRYEYPIVTATDEKRWVLDQAQPVYEDGQLKTLEGLIIDITDRKIKEEEINYIGSHDVLTGLYNRRYFEEQLKNYDKEEFLPLSVITGDINGLKLTNDALGHFEGDKLIKALAEILENSCRENYILTRTSGDEFNILMPNTCGAEADSIIKQIIGKCESYKLNINDTAYNTSISLGCATKTSADESMNDILKVAEENMYRNKMLQSQSLHSAVISSMKMALNAKSNETEAHAQRMVKLAKAAGRALKLTDQQINELILLSTLHDIGKIGVSDNILNKPGKLSDHERREIEKHPEIGYRIAMASAELLPIAKYILCHHERWDGTGYPQGLKGEEIPLLSRVIALVDAYDAMTQDRAYGKAVSKIEAIKEINKYKGMQFDPVIADIFINKVLENFKG
jgi:diguanylate cyclase (GGDEF)-like protein/PAS domain S-box-containing protein